MNSTGPLAMAVDVFERGLGGNDAVVLGLFKDGDAAEVGIGKENAGVVTRLRKAEALFGKHRPDSRANHGVAHAHDVNARNALANVGVNALEVVENSFLPIIPVLFEKELTVLRGSAVG